MLSDCEERPVVSISTNAVLSSNCLYALSDDRAGACVQKKHGFFLIAVQLIPQP